MLIAPLLRMQALDCVIADRPYAAVVMTSANAARAVSHDRARQVETLLLSLDEAADMRTVAEKLGRE